MHVANGCDLEILAPATYSLAASRPYNGMLVCARHLTKKKLCYIMDDDD